MSEGPPLLPDRWFTAAWASAWRDRLNASPLYREAAAEWEGDVVLAVADPAGETRAVYLDLVRGECRAARTASEEDRDQARYLVEGTAQSWHRVLTGRTSLVMAVLTGALRLTRGTLAELLPYARAAQALVTSAAPLPDTEE